MTIEQFIQVMNNKYFTYDCYHTAKNPSNYTSLNHHVINATYYAQLNRYNAQTEKDRLIAQRFIEACRDESGVFNRIPGNFDQLQAHDDLLSIVTTSKILHLPYAGEIYDYGNKWRFPKFKGIPIPVKWYYDSTEESKEFDVRCFHGRFPWLIAYYKACDNIELNLFDKLAYSLYLLNDANESGNILRWLTISQMKGKYKIVDKAIKMWENNIIKKYGTMNNVFALYHAKDHPFANLQ